jgi:hypothetical protein
VKNEHMSHAFEDCVAEMDIPEDEVECGPEGQNLYKVLQVGAARSNKHRMECVIKASEEMKDEVMEECCIGEVHGKVSQDKSRVGIYPQIHKAR